MDNEIIIKDLLTVKHATEEYYKWEMDDEMLTHVVNRGLNNIKIRRDFKYSGVAFGAFNLFDFLPSGEAHINLAFFSTLSEASPAMYLMNIEIFQGVQIGRDIDSIWNTVFQSENINQLSNLLSNRHIQNIQIRLGHDNELYLKEKISLIMASVKHFEKIKGMLEADKVNTIKAKIKFGIPVDIKEVDNQTMVDLI